MRNPIEERYASPLRKDPRPMDGIYHAAFVCARLFYLFERINADQRDVFEDHDRIPVDAHLDDLKGRFFSSLQTITEFGRLSQEGERIMADTSDDMKRVA